MKRYPIILSIAGSDCSGGAGIQADIKTIAALGGYAASAITAITVQNTLGVHAIHATPPTLIQQQVEAAMNDLKPDAIKIGMIAEEAAVRAIADCLRKYHHPCVIYDPVMVATSGKKLINDQAIQAVKTELFPLVNLITPNLDEAEVLIGWPINSFEKMQQAALELSQTYHTHVLIKGGHLDGDEMMDVLYVAPATYVYKEKRIDSANLHGTGCTLSSAIATYRALGFDWSKSVQKAKKYTYEAIRAGRFIQLGDGNGPLCHSWNPVKMQFIEPDNKK